MLCPNLADAFIYIFVQDKVRRTLLKKISCCNCRNKRYFVTYREREEKHFLSGDGHSASFEHAVNVNIESMCSLHKNVEITAIKENVPSTYKYILKYIFLF